MTTVYLVRHGEAEGNIYRRLHGQYDGDLTDNGLRQVRYLEERFRSIHLDAVYSSDLRRCQKTARALYRHKNLPLHLDKGLREMSMGAWEDKPWGELGRTDPEGIMQFRLTSREFRAPGGERFEEVRDRVADTILRLAARHDGETIGLSTHFLAMRSALSRFHGCPVEEINQVIPKCDNTGVTCLEIQGDKVRIVFECDSSHLPPELSTINKQNWKRNNNVAAPESNLWYRPWDPEQEGELYRAFRREYDPDWTEDGRAWKLAVQQPWSVVCVMQGDRVAGLLQLDAERSGDAGYIDFYYLIPELRRQGLGIQPLGQAVHYFRPMGKKSVLGWCNEKNTAGLGFCRKYGFAPADRAAGKILLEKHIE